MSKTKISGVLAVAALLVAIASSSQATLTTIGTATYNNAEYKIIYDNDSPFGSIVWLDYTHGGATWESQIAWANSLDSVLTYNLYAGYSVTWDAASGWRLPSTVDGLFVYGYNGTNTYTYGWNITSSEFGHLFYTELGNSGSTSIYETSLPPRGLIKGPFENLQSYVYWSGTEYSADPSIAWAFRTDSGGQGANNKTDSHLYGIAVHSVQVVQNTTPVPEPSTLLLLGAGLGGLVLYRRKQKS